MPRLSKPVVVRLAVFLTATLLVLAGLQLSSTSEPALTVEDDRIDLAESDLSGRAALPSAVPTHPLALPGPQLKAQARSKGRADGSKAGSGSGKPAQSDQRRTQPGKAQKSGRAKGSASSSGRTGSANRGAGRGSVPQGGRDISWPQCPPNVGIPDLKGQSQPMPPPDIRFVIVGLTNGRAFTRNPCLGRHLDFVRKHHVWAAAYAFATYPTDKQLRLLKNRGPFNGKHFGGKLRNAGYASARYNIRTMEAHGFVTPHVWLDVEASSSRPWSGRPEWNRAVVDGWIRAYRDAGYTVGFYSTIHIWEKILGNARYGLPEWRTAGPANAGAALGRCHERSFQGGRAVLAQWWDSKRDYNRMCPGFAKSRTMTRYFHKY